MPREFDDLAPTTAKGPLDGMFANTNIVVLILFGVCCGVIALVLSLIAYLTAKSPKAKSNALIVLIISGIITVLGVGAQFLGLAPGLAGGAGAPQ